MINTPPEIQIDEVPIEIRYKGVLTGLMGRIKGLYEEIYERFGLEGLEMIRDVSVAYGSQIAQKARKDAVPWEIEQVGRFLVKVFNNVDAVGEVVEFNSDRIAIKVHKCPYPFNSTKICDAHTCMERALVRGLNPSFEYEIEKSIPAGDPYCLHVLTKSLEETE